MDKLPERLQVARLRLCITHPYLGAAAWSLTPVEDPTLGTIGVDKWARLYFDTKAVDKWTTEEVIGALYHEISHLLRNHHGRFSSSEFRDRYVNHATDCEINDDLRDEGTKLPENSLYPDTVYGFPIHLLAEEYYDMLLKKFPPNQNQIAIICDCGSVSGGQQRPWEKGPPGGCDKDGKPNPEGTGVIEQEVMREKVARDVREAASKANDSQTCGNVPQEWVRWAESVLKPKVDWRKELRGAVRSAIGMVAGMEDYSWRKPNRRQAACKAILPSLRSTVPKVAVQVDTSGSMGDTKLSQALAEVEGVLRHVGQPIEVLSVDAAVHRRDKISRMRDVKLVGGGGTDMGVGIAAIATSPNPPDLLVVITDGYTPWPSAPFRGLKVIAVILRENGDGSHEPPSWIRTVEVR